MTHVFKLAILINFWWCRAFIFFFANLKCAHVQNKRHTILCSGATLTQIWGHGSSWTKWCASFKVGICYFMSCYVDFRSTCKADMGTKLLRLHEAGTFEAKASASASWFQELKALASASWLGKRFGFISSQSRNFYLVLLSQNFKKNFNITFHFQVTFAIYFAWISTKGK